MPRSRNYRYGLQMSELVQANPTRGNVTSHEIHDRGSALCLPYKILIPLLCILLVGLTICLFYFYKRKRPSRSSNTEENSFNKCAVNCTFADVQIATDGFSDRNLLGKSRYATVFKAVSPQGHIIAVKRIDPGHVLSKPGFSFSSEMKSLARAQHPHIVPVIGYCEAPAERIILLEFMVMNTLDYHLHNRCGILFDWCQRAKIAAEAAQGIEYLHEGSGSHIVHGDIRPSNILFDSTLSARVADFGLSFIVHPNGLPGSIGYLDPEYYRHSTLCKASDIYGFGVVLLELLSGRKCFGGDLQSDFIVNWAVPLVRNSRASEIFDPSLEAPRNCEPLVRMAKLASACVSNMRKDRPTIMEVAAILKDLHMGCIAPGTCRLPEHFCPDRHDVYSMCKH